MGTIKDLIKLAENEVGYLEKKSNSNLDSKTANSGDKNFTKYARDLDNIQDFYNGKKNGYPWCAVFVDWLFVQIFGVDKTREIANRPVKSLSAGATQTKQYYKKMGRYYSTPEIGDQVIFRNSKGASIHTGIVYNVDKNYVYTIEGNTSSGKNVIENGGEVCKKAYKLGYKYIDGYGRPNYSQEDKDVETYKIKYVSGVDDEGLCVRNAPNGTNTGELLQTATEVKVYEMCGLWARIDTNKWVYSKYLSDKCPAYREVYNVKRPPLNVRNKPSVLNSRVVGTLYNGNRVQIYKIKKGWAKVSNEEERYVSADYLR